MRVQIASEITHERRVQIERARTDNIKHTQKKKENRKERETEFNWKNWSEWRQQIIYSGEEQFSVNCGSNKH